MIPAMDAPAPSLTAQVRPVAAETYVSGIHWLGGNAAFACGDGIIRIAGADGHVSTVEAHPDAAILVTGAFGERLLTGGDDGRVVATDASGRTETIADENGRWIDAVAANASGALAWSAGKKVVARDAKGRADEWQAPTSARGLAFAPKGYRLAIAHYNGASLWFPGTKAEPEFLDWKGSHLDITWSPDGRFIVTSMQENALHGWRLQPDKGHMRMTGYAAKPRSMSWSADGKWLATSGADAVIVWPFDTKEGPSGKRPREAGVRHAKVSRVACHPKALIVALGYEDGCVLLVRLTDATELLVRPAVKGSMITALAWDAKGARLAYGASDGQAGLLTLPAG